MDSSIPIQIAETIQTTSINRAPSPSHDLNPSTAASQKQPVSIFPNALASDASLDKFAYGGDDGFDEEEDQEDIPYSVITPVQRRASFPPLPDLRFEQSYLQSISNCDTMWKVAYITMRDQVFLPLLQGIVWSLALHGWRYWNRSAQTSGNTVGVKIRRWWYRTNNWPLKDSSRTLEKDLKLAEDITDYYQNQSSAGD